ncbi:glycosyltransferase family 9 protein [Hyphococcus sp. DH-69]|uniref:glycosyltransferase family 9 protein n=1 Tax=Hyphococcus formosus TaxID=3143534 RepID=UPI00398BAB1D
MLGRKQNNILVIKTDGLRGFVAADPYFEAIRDAYPKAKISLLTTQGLQRIARASPYFDQVAAMPNMGDREARKEFVRQLKASKFERVYDLSGDAAARRLRSAMGPFRPKWFAAEQAPKPNPKSAQPLPLPNLEKISELSGLSVDDRLPDLRWAVSARKDSANMQPSWYGISGPFGLLLPSEDGARRWSASGYAGLARQMAESGFMPVLAGSKNLHGFGDEIANEAPQLLDLSGKTDHLQLAALAQEAAFFVSDVSDEMQLALSVGCEGAVICPAKSPYYAEGRHIVTLTAENDLGAIEPSFVWRTLDNMGLINNAHSDQLVAEAR